MIKQLYENICEDRDVRANLIALRQELKDRAVRRAFAYLLGGEFGQLTQLLHSEDPKIRKNAGPDSGRYGDGGCASVSL